MLTSLSPISSHSFTGKAAFQAFQGPVFVARTYKGIVYFTREDIRPKGISNVGIRFKETAPITMATWAMLFPCVD